MGNSFLLICLPPQTCESWDSIFPRDRWRWNWPVWKSKKHQETQSLLMHASSSLQEVKRSRTGTWMDWNFSHLHWFLTCTMWQCGFVWKKCAPLNLPVNFNLIIMFTIESYTGHSYIHVFCGTSTIFYVKARVGFSLPPKELSISDYLDLIEVAEEHETCISWYMGKLPLHTDVPEMFDDICNAPNSPWRCLGGIGVVFSRSGGHASLSWFL